MGGRAGRVHNPGMRVPLLAVPAVGALVAVSATALPLVLHGREPDVVNLAVGLVLLVAGAQLIALAQTRAAGILLEIASLAWFAPDLASSVPIAGSILAAATRAHVAPMVGAVLVAPQGRLLGRADRAVVLLALAASASAVTGGHQAVVPAVGAALVVAFAVDGGFSRGFFARPDPRAPARRARNGDRTDGHPARAICRIGQRRVAVHRIRGSACGGGHGPGESRAAWLRRTAELDVGPDAVVALDGLLAEVTGDPRAHAVVDVGEGRWVRLDGGPAAAPGPTSEHVVAVTAGVVPPTMRRTIAEGLRLAGDNVLARRLVEDRVRELADVRTRLIRVEEGERAVLVASLRRGPLSTLADLGADLATAGAGEALLEQIRGTERDLERVAAGLDPLEAFASVADAVRTLAHQFGAAADIDTGISLSKSLWAGALVRLRRSPDELRQTRTRLASKRPARRRTLPGAPHRE